MPTGIFHRFLDDLAVMIAVDKPRGKYPSKWRAGAQRRQMRLLKLVVDQPLPDLRLQVGGRDIFSLE